VFRFTAIFDKLTQIAVNKQWCYIGNALYTKLAMVCFPLLLEEIRNYLWLHVQTHFEGDWGARVFFSSESRDYSRPRILILYRDKEYVNFTPISPIRSGKEDNVIILCSWRLNSPISCTRGLGFNFRSETSNPDWRFLYCPSVPPQNSGKVPNFDHDVSFPNPF